MLTIDWWK